MKIIDKLKTLSQRKRDVISTALITVSCLTISVYFIYYTGALMPHEHIFANQVFASIIAFFFSCIIFVSFYFLRRQRSIVAQTVLSTERFRHVSDSSGDWIWETDREGLYVYSSKGVKNILGYDPKEIVGKKYFYDFCFLEDMASVKQKAYRQIEQQQFFLYETGRRKHKDGREVILEVKGFAIRDKEGRIVGYRGIDRDITGMLQAQETIKKEKNFVSAVFDIIGALVVVLDMEGRIIRFNRTCEWLTGYMFDEVKEKCIWDIFILPEEMDAVKDRFNELREGKRSNEGENYWVTKEGKRRLIKWSNTTLRGEYIIGTGIDITDQRATEVKLAEQRKALQQANKDLEADERLLRDMVNDLQMTNKELKETQDKLVQSEKMASVGVVSSAIAHEIKNPMAIILQSLERIEKVFSATEQDGSRYVDRIKNAANRANRVIDSLLIFSRQSELKMKPLSINKTIDFSLNLIENKAANSNVSIELDYEKNEPLIKGDDVTLQQVFFDLFNNAIDAMPKGGKITVKTFLNNSQKIGESPKYIAEITDTGEGIPSDIKRKIFEPFFTTKEPGAGTGLGLSVVYLIIERHGGKISLESREGVGTKFTITFPVEKLSNS